MESNWKIGRIIIDLPGDGNYGYFAIFIFKILKNNFEARNLANLLVTSWQQEESRSNWLSLAKAIATTIYATMTITPKQKSFNSKLIVIHIYFIFIDQTTVPNRIELIQLWIQLETVLWQETNWMEASFTFHVIDYKFKISITLYNLDTAMASNFYFHESRCMHLWSNDGLCSIVGNGCVMILQGGNFQVMTQLEQQNQPLILENWYLGNMIMSHSWWRKWCHWGEWRKWWKIW